jgi:hypothetical protein
MGIGAVEQLSQIPLRHRRQRKPPFGERRESTTDAILDAIILPLNPTTFAGREAATS